MFIMFPLFVGWERFDTEQTQAWELAGSWDLCGVLESGYLLHT